jgi:hypothetical protein
MVRKMKNDSFGAPAVSAVSNDSSASKEKTVLDTIMKHGVANNRTVFSKFQKENNDMGITKNSVQFLEP